MKNCKREDFGLVIAGVARIWTVAACMLAPLSLLAQQPVTVPTPIDVLVFADSQSEAQHQLQSRGKTSTENVNYRIGTIGESYATRVIQGKDSTLSFTLDAKTVLSNTAPVVLEIQEIHKRQREVFGYMINVNGKDVYFRTYQELAAGPNHYFVQLGRELAGADGKLNVTIRNEGEAPVHFGRIWAYSDFYALAEAEKVYQKLIIMGLPAPFAEKPGTSKDPSVRTFPLTKAVYDHYAPMLRNYRIGFDFGIPGQSGAKRQAWVDSVMRIGSELGVPIQITAGGWGGAITGMDGEGGYLDDLKYSQAVYNPETKQFGPSFPNSVGSTAWVTMNAPTRNKIAFQRKENLAAMIAWRQAFLNSGDLKVPSVVMCGDVGVDYGKIGEFSDYALAQAKADGITLDPENLTPAARMWFFDNRSRYYAQDSAGLRRGLGRDSIPVDRGKVQLPESQTADNIYAHPWFWNTYPTSDEAYVGWQNGVTADSWTSGEMADTYPAWYDYIKSRGKIGCVNMEVGRATAPRIGKLYKWYQWGWQMVTFYSATYDKEAAKGDVDEAIRKADAMDGEPSLSPEHYERILLDVRFARDGNLGETAGLIESKNLQVVDGRPELVDLNQPGVLTYRIRPDGKAFDNQLRLELMAALNDPADRIEILTGASVSSMKSVRVLQRGDFEAPSHFTGEGWGIATMEMGDAMKGRQEWFLRLIYTSKDSLKRTCLRNIHVLTPWEIMSGPVAAKTPTVRQSRILNLWIQDRAVFARLLSRYKELGGEDNVWKKAQELFNEGLYCSGYRYLSGEFSQLLPARYAVRGHGKLGRWPVEIRLADENKVALVDVLKMTADGADFTIHTEESQICQLRLTGLAEGKSFKLARDEQGHYQIISAQEGGLRVEKGVLQVELNLAPARKNLPLKITGVFSEADKKEINLMVGDTSIDNGEKAVTLPLAENVVFKRRQEGTNVDRDYAPGGWDLVELTLDAEGRVTEVLSRFGTVRGRVKSFQKPSIKGEFCNGIVELEDGKRFVLGYVNNCTRIDLAAMSVWCPRMTTADKLVEILKPGTWLDVNYSPYQAKPGAPYRAIILKFPYRVLLKEEFKSEATLKEKAVLVENLEYGKGLISAPSANSAPGRLIYRITSDKPMGTTAVHVLGQLMLDPRMKLEFFTSADQKNWSKAGELTGRDPIGVNMPSFVNLTPAVQGKRDFYLKIEFQHYGRGTFAAIRSLEVRTEEALPDLPTSVNKK